MIEFQFPEKSHCRKCIKFSGMFDLESMFTFNIKEDNYIATVDLN